MYILMKVWLGSLKIEAYAYFRIQQNLILWKCDIGVHFLYWKSCNLEF